MLKFGDKVVGKVQIEKELTENDIENIIVTGFEGGINYWAGLNKEDKINKDAFKDKPRDEPTSTWSTKILLEGGEIKLYDIEGDSNDSNWIITLPEILEGYRLNYVKRPWDNDIENGDATTADCIIQYAIFGDIMFG